MDPSSFSMQIGRWREHLNEKFVQQQTLDDGWSLKVCPKGSCLPAKPIKSTAGPISETAGSTTHPLHGCLHLLQLHPLRVIGGKLYTSTFATNQTLHWPWKEGDEYLNKQFKESDMRGSITSILAATASGKTSLSFRALSKQYGLYLTCTHYQEGPTFGPLCDRQMVCLHHRIEEYSQEDLLVKGLPCFQMAIIARLVVLIHRTEEYIASHDGKRPSPSEFTLWQVNGDTERMVSAFLRFDDEYYRPQVYIQQELKYLAEKLADLLGVTWLPLFIDEANNYARLIADGRVVVTRNGTIRDDGYLSLMLQSAIEASWMRAPIILTGTGFSTEVSKIIQSAGGESDEKANPRSISEFIGHPLVENGKEVKELLGKVITVPSNMKECIDSPRFQSYLPMRRRVLVSILRKWWELYGSVKEEPSSEKVLEAAQSSYENSVREHVTALKNLAGIEDLDDTDVESAVKEKPAAKGKPAAKEKPFPEEDFLRGLGVARFLSVNQEEVSLFEKASFLRKVVKTSSELYRQFIASGFCTYHLANGKRIRDLKPGANPEGEISFLLSEPLARDTLAGLLHDIRHAASLRYFVDDIEEFARQHDAKNRDAGGKLHPKPVSNYYELLSCLVLQSLFAIHPDGLGKCDFIKRQKESNSFPDSAEQILSAKIEIKAVLVGERSLIRVLDRNIMKWDVKYLKDNAPKVKVLKKLLDEIRPTRPGGESKKSVLLPKVDRIIACVLENDLHPLLEGYLVFPSPFLKPDAIAIAKVSVDNQGNAIYGLVLSTTKRLTTVQETVIQNQLECNAYQCNYRNVYLSQKRIVLLNKLRTFINEMDLDQWHTWLKKMKEEIKASNKNEVIQTRQNMIQEKESLITKMKKPITEEAELTQRRIESEIEAIKKEIEELTIFFFSQRFATTEQENSAFVFGASAETKCRTKDGYNIPILLEEYACSVFDDHARVEEGIKMRRLLSQFKHHLPIAICMQRTSSDKTDHHLICSDIPQLPPVTSNGAFHFFRSDLETLLEMCSKLEEKK